MMILRKLGLVAALAIPVAVTGGIGARLLAGQGSPGPDDEARVVQPSPRDAGKTLPRDDPAGRALEATLPGAAKTADPYNFTFALIRLAKARHASGDDRSALEALRLADQIAQTVKDDHLRFLAVVRTAVRRAQFGDREAAHATIEGFARKADTMGPERRSDWMSMVIGFLYDAGFDDEAKARLTDELARVEAIPDRQTKDGGIYRLIHNQVAMGDYEGAFRQVESYTGARSNWRQPLIDIIVRWRATAARHPAPREVVDRALRLTREMADPYPRARSLAEVAPALARAGDVEGGLRLARDIGIGDPAPWGDGARAEVPSTLAEIARIQAGNGDVAGARKTLREAWALGRRGTQRDLVLVSRLRRVGDAAAEIGDVEAARMAVDEVEGDPTEKALAPAGLARAQIKVGDPKAALATLDEAMKHARVIGPRELMKNDNPVANADEATRTIALARAEAGDVAGAIAFISGRGSDAWKSEVLAAIAPIQARRGDLPGALATARSIRVPASAGEAYCEIAAIQTRRDGPDAAMAWAANLEPPAARAYALIGIADGMAARATQKPNGAPRKP